MDSFLYSFVSFFFSILLFFTIHSGKEGSRFLVEAAVPVFLGVNGRGSSNVNLQGVSFSFLPDDAVFHSSTVTGKSLAIDLDRLAIATSHGLLAFTPQGINFTRGNGQWFSELSDERVEIKRNGQSVLQMTASDRLELYSFRYNGMGYFNDLTIDKAQLASVFTNLCIADRKLNGLARKDTEELCASEASRWYLTLSQLLDRMAKILTLLSDGRGGESSQPDQIQRRLKAGYEEAIKSIQQDLQQELQRVREHYESYDAWQESKKEALENVTSIHSSIEEMDSRLSSNILYVEERQDEMFHTVEQMSTRNEDSLKALAEEIAVNVSRTLAESHDAIVSDSRSILANQALILDKRVASIESDLNLTTTQLNDWQNSYGSWRIIVNGSLIEMTDAIASFPLKLAEAADTSVKLLMGKVDSTILTLREDVLNWTSNNEKKMESALSLIDGKVSLLEKSSDGIRSELLTRLENVNHTLFDITDDLKNFTIESSDWLWEQVKKESGDLHRELLSLNLTLLHSISRLENKVQDTDFLVLNISETSKEYMNNILNNVSISLAHSNGIFARVIKELNLSVSVLKENQQYFEEKQVPEMISKETSKLATEFRVELQAASESFNAQLIQLEGILGVNLTSLKNEVLKTLQSELGFVNKSIEALDKLFDKEILSLRNGLVEQEQKHQHSLVELEGLIASNMSQLKSKIDNEGELLKIAQNELKGEVNDSLQAVNQTISHELLMMRKQIAGDVNNLTIQLVGSNQSLSQEISVLSMAVAEIDSHYNETLSSLRDYILNELVNEHFDRKQSLDEFKGVLLTINETLSGRLGELDHRHESALDNVMNFVNQTSDSLARDHKRDYQNLTALLTSVLESLESSIVTNATVLLRVIQKSVQEVEANQLVMQENFTQTLQSSVDNIDANQKLLSDHFLSKLVEFNTSNAEQMSNLSRNLLDVQTSFDRNLSDFVAKTLHDNDYFLSMLVKLEHEQNSSNALASSSLQQVNETFANEVRIIKDALSDLDYVQNNSFHFLHDKLSASADQLHQFMQESYRAQLEGYFNLSQAASRFEESLLQNNESAQLQFENFRNDIDNVVQTINSHKQLSDSELGKWMVYYDEQLSLLSANMSKNMSAAQASLWRQWMQSIEEMKQNQSMSFAEIGIELGRIVEAGNDALLDLHNTLDRHVFALNRKLDEANDSTFALKRTFDDQSIMFANDLEVLNASVTLRFAQEKEYLNDIHQEITDSLKQHFHQTESKMKDYVVQTNVSLLQQQVVVAVQGEKISQLEREVLQQISSQEVFQKGLFGAEQSIAMISKTQQSQSEELSSLSSTMAGLTTEQLPTMSSDLALLQYGLRSLQQSQETLSSETILLLDRQWQLSGNVTLLHDHLMNEVELRVKGDEMLSNSINSKIDTNHAVLTKHLANLQERSDKDHEELLIANVAVPALRKELDEANKEIVSLKSQVATTSQLQSEVGSLKEHIITVEGQLRDQKESHEREIGELRRANDKSSDLLLQMQKLIERQGEMITSLQQEQVQLKTFCAERGQVDQLKDRLMDVQQGTFQQVADILQLIQANQQAASKVDTAVVFTSAPSSRQNP
eukprot:gene3554-3893_t